MRFRLRSKREGKYRLYQIVDNESGEVVSECNDPEKAKRELREYEESEGDLFDWLSDRGVE